MRARGPGVRGRAVAETAEAPGVANAALVCAAGRTRRLVVPTCVGAAVGAAAIGGGRR